MSGTRITTLLLVVLLVGQLLLMTANVRGTDGTTVLESWLMRWTAPVVRGGHSLGGGVGAALDAVTGLVTARGRVVLLEAELRRLRGRVEAQREAERENVRLRRLLDMRAPLAPASLAASTVTATLDGQTRMIVIDRGTASGLRPEMAVVTWGGAVGRVLVSGPEHAKVRLITDPESGVAGVVQRSRARGIVFGTGGDRLEMRFVPAYADVAHGDRVVTSGLEGIFPRGYGLGRVVGIETAIDGSLLIQLEPEVSFEQLEEVLVLLERVGGDALDPPMLEADGPTDDAEGTATPLARGAERGAEPAEPVSEPPPEPDLLEEGGGGRSAPGARR